ncbi:MAG: ATP-dependent RNA helicase HrpA [Pirellulaceae bacterium]|nr:ATP-dependent RNA helicase HrpA [Pirellulaceae bacterium]
MTDALSAIESRIDEAMLADRFSLRRSLHKLRRSQDAGQLFDRQLEKVVRRLEVSTTLFTQRKMNVPQCTFPSDLPINRHRDEISAALYEQQVLVVCGETGSGKSTQLPKICLAAGRGVAGFIGHTQPRRIAARSVASRLADELNSKLGQHVGYKIRFTDNLSRTSYVKLMTDGILLAETQGDRFLEKYDTIIIDEAHERSLNIDFLLGYFKQLLRKRDDLRLIITSATIDAGRFAKHFSHRGKAAPVIEVSGRGHPVEMRYRPLDTTDNDSVDTDEHQGILSAVEELRSAGPGDILIFLPTERDIRETARRLRGWTRRWPDKPAILPLYARLPTADQNRIFQTTPTRRIVLATNVAESSLTVPGIRYVIDTGTARISRYAPRSKVQRLPIELISRASADQRAGRCGRTGPGICIRLFSEQDFLSRSRYTTPEIRRTNLAAVILRMLSLKLGKINNFPFLDAPQKEAVRDGFRTLYELGATTKNGELTDIGRQIARWPVDPRISRMILSSSHEKCVREILIIASALEIHDPRERPTGHEKGADAAHARYAHPSSDFLTYLNLWDYFQNLKQDLSRRQLRRRCTKEFLSFNRLREWQDVHRQLKQLLQESGFETNAHNKDYAAIHRSLLSGLLSNVAKKIDRREYQGLGGMKSVLWPGSHVIQENPKWLVAAEIIETSRRYLRTAARISVNWIEPLANHLIERTYKNPHWSRKQGTVLASEKIHLFEMPVTTHQGKPYGAIDPIGARDLFIREALIQGDFSTQVEFFCNNRELVEGLAIQAAKFRNKELLVPEAREYAFYNERIPTHVYDARTLRKWLRRDNDDKNRLLTMNRQDLISTSSVETNSAEFPDVIRTGALAVKANYHFEPGDEDDGICITVPTTALSQVDTEQLEWLVPGLLHEKIVGLIRSLPKSIRTGLIPAPDVAQRAIKSLTFGEGPFLPTLAKALGKISGELIDPRAFRLQTLPQHLRVKIRIVDDAGKLLASSRDLGSLRKQLGLDQSDALLTIESRDWQQDDLRDWSFNHFPEKIDVIRNGLTIPGYPMLIDHGDTVSLRLARQQEAAQQVTEFGLRRLFVLTESQELQDQIDWLPNLEQLEMFAIAMKQSNLRQQLVDLLAGLAFLNKSSVPRNPEDFQLLRKQTTERCAMAIQDLVKIVFPLFRCSYNLQLTLDKLPSQRWVTSVADIRQHLNDLLPQNFLTKTRLCWLKHFPRYLTAIETRLQRLSSGNLERDVQATTELLALREQYHTRKEELDQRGILDTELEHFRWMIEEYRVSIFAQQLGTSLRISAKRLAEQWTRVRS